MKKDYYLYKGGRRLIDYEAVFNAVKDLDFFTAKTLKDLTGIQRNYTSVIISLSLMFPVYELEPGKYAVLK